MTGWPGAVSRSRPFLRVVAPQRTVERVYVRVRALHGHVLSTVARVSSLTVLALASASLVALAGLARPQVRGPAPRRFASPGDREAAARASGARQCSVSGWSRVAARRTAPSRGGRSRPQGAKPVFALSPRVRGLVSLAASRGRGVRLPSRRPVSVDLSGARVAPRRAPVVRLAWVAGGTAPLWPPARWAAVACPREGTQVLRGCERA